MERYYFGLYLLLQVIYPLQTDQMRNSDNSATSCSTFTLHDLWYNTPKYWADSLLQNAT